MGAGDSVASAGTQSAGPPTTCTLADGCWDAIIATSTDAEPRTCSRTVPSYSCYSSACRA